MRRKASDESYRPHTLRARVRTAADARLQQQQTAARAAALGCKRAYNETIESNIRRLSMDQDVVLGRLPTKDKIQHYRDAEKRQGGHGEKDPWHESTPRS